VGLDLLTLAFERPAIDWHAIAPELVLLTAGCLITLVDIVFLEKARPYTAALAGIGLLATAVPLLTLAVEGTDRVMFDGAYVVDEFSLVMKALFLLAGYVVVLLSTNYVAEGDYWENEYYGLLLASLMGMVMMASARDLVSIFVALELLSIPAYLLVAWRKRDLHSTEAGLKYYLMGVFASAVMLYGMSLLYGVAGSTMLSDIGASLAAMGTSPAVVTMGIVFVVAGFAFKVSAAPFHTWAPDVYEGAPTPVTAFLSVASKAAGFVALLVFVFVGFYARSEVWEPLFWILAALSMTVGNLVALRQTNVVRLMAYSGIAHRLHDRPTGRRRSRCGQRRPGPFGRGHLPGDLRGNEPGCLHRGHCVGTAFRVGRDQFVQRGLPVRPGPDGRHVHLPVLPGRHSAAGRMVRQVRGVPRARHRR